MIEDIRKHFSPHARIQAMLEVEAALADAEAAAVPSPHV